MFGEKIVAVPGFLAETTFQRLLDAFQRQRQSQRVHIPVHKRGAALSYHDLQHSAPEIISFCTERAAGRLQALERRFKDIAYFGIRALWT